MNTRRFDYLTRVLVTTSSRRDLIRALTGIVLGSAAAVERMAPIEAKKCGPCRKKKKGKCKKKKPNDTSCNGDGKCLNGKCNPPPECTVSPGFCDANSDCCSGSCSFPISECNLGAAGTPCVSGSNCASGVCTGFRCQ